MKKIVAIALALVLCLSLVSFASAETYKVGVLVPEMTHGWVSGITYYAQQYAEKLAAEGTIDYKVYICTNAETMTSAMDEAILWGAQGLVLSPQWTGMEVPVQDAIDQGVVVVAFDMDIAADGVYKVTGDNKSMGVAGAKFIVEKIGTEGTVVAMPVPKAGSVNDLRMEGFKETMAELAPNVTIIEAANESFSNEVGHAVMADVLTANDKIDAVYSLDDETSLGAVQAIAEAGRTDVKAITGGGGCQNYFKVIKETEIPACSSQLYSPMMIENCFDVVLAVLNGETPDAVVVIPSANVDASNVDEYLDANNTIY